jgi:hypothetical protein
MKTLVAWPMKQTSMLLYKDFGEADWMQLQEHPYDVKWLYKWTYDIVKDDEWEFYEGLPTRKAETEQQKPEKPQEETQVSVHMPLSPRV